MGSLQAAEFAQMDVDIETALAWHLRGNHYPPIPSVMIQPCIEAIDAYWEDNLDKLIPLPKMEDGFQIRWKNGATEAPARAIIEHAHLYAWCEEEEFEE
jgi:hypothetical protein